MGKKKYIGRLVAAALMGLSLQAQALVQGQAQITQVQWTVVDLTPGDGIAASIDFSGLGSFWQAFGAEPFLSQSGAGAVGTGTGGSVSAQTFSALARLEAGMPAVVGSGPSGYVSGSARGSDAITHAMAAVLDGEVTLGPHTGLVLSAGTKLSFQVELLGERATGFAGVLIFRPDHPEDWIQSMSSFEAYFDHADMELLPLTQVSFDNSGTTPMTVRISASAMVDTVSVFAAVPEPSTPATMLAGIAILAGRLGLRRRRTAGC